MEITLEQGLAAVVRYIQDHAEEGTKLYFDELPEDFYVPSVYFQIPFTSGRKATLRTYCTAITLNCWFMEAQDWDAYAKAAEMRDSIMLDNCVVPLYDVEGNRTGRGIRTGFPDTRKIADGTVQLSLSFDIYFRPEEEHQKMQKLYIAWKDVKQNFNGQEVG